VIRKHERDYIVWQNRATDFYLAARVLIRAGLHRPAAFCAAQSIEILLKATLVYFDADFVPEERGHAMAKMFRMLKNRLKSRIRFKIPDYFIHDRRYMVVARYPSRGKGIGIPSSFLGDLDATFADLVTLVPFQFNSGLASVLGMRAAPQLDALEFDNGRLRDLRAAVGLEELEARS